MLDSPLLMIHVPRPMKIEFQIGTTHLSAIVPQLGDKTGALEIFLSGSIDDESGSDQRGTLCRLVTHRRLTTRAASRGRCHCAHSPIEGICRATAPTQADHHGAEKSHSTPRSEALSQMNHEMPA